MEDWWWDLVMKCSPVYALWGGNYIRKQSTKNNTCKENINWGTPWEAQSSAIHIKEVSSSPTKPLKKVTGRIFWIIYNFIEAREKTYELFFYKACRKDWGLSPHIRKVKIYCNSISWVSLFIVCNWKSTWVCWISSHWSSLWRQCCSGSRPSSRTSEK